MFTASFIAVLMASPMPQGATVDTTITYTPGTTCRVINPAGRVVVRGVEGTTIRIRGTFPQGDRLDVDRSGGLQIQRVVAGVPANAAPVTLELDVPRGATIDLLGQRTDMEVTGVQARVAIRTRDGNVSLRGGRGIVVARSVNGSVSVTGADGALDLRSTSQSVSVDSSRGDVTIDTRSGDISLPVDGFRMVKITSLSGHVRLRGAPGRESALEASSHSGDVTLTLGAGANAEIRGETTNGHVEWRVPNATLKANQLLLGSGGAAVILRSFGGTVTVIKRQ